MTSPLSGVRSASLIVAASLALACSADRSSAPPPPGTDALAAADMLSRLADSSRGMGDTADAIPLDNAADALRRTRRFSTITISVDGAPTTFNAVAQLWVIDDLGRCAGGGPVTVPPPDSVVPGAMMDTAGAGGPARLPVAPPPECFLRFAPNLVAWEPLPAATSVPAGASGALRPRPPMVLYVHADTGTVVFGAPPPTAVGGSATIADTATTPPTFVKYGSAILSRGPRLLWWATDGSMQSDVTTDGTSCFTDPASLAFLPPNPCLIAEFHDAFEMTMEPVPFMGPLPGATGAVKLAMEKQAVAGMIVTVQLPPPPPLPPPDTGRARLTARLGVGVTDAGVHFEFVVANVGRAPAIVHFPTGQRFDVIVQDASAHEVWRWSSTADFLADPVTDTIPAGSARVFTGDWLSPNVRGRMLAIAQLTSSNAPIGAVEMFTIP